MLAHGCIPCHLEASVLAWLPMVLPLAWAWMRRVR